MIPVGNHKGAAAFLDLDNLINQPVLLAEKAYALDRNDDREVVDVKIGAGAEISSIGRDKMTIPTR